MKCLLICNYFQPKIPYAESQIAHALQQLGHQVEIITGDRYFPFPNYQETVQSILGPRQLVAGEKTEQGLTVERKKIYLEFFARTLYSGIQQKIESYKPDVVICFGLTTPGTIQACWSKIQASKKNTTKPFSLIGVDSHLPSEFNSGNILFKKLFYTVFRFFFSQLLSNQLDKVIAVQEGTLEIIKQYYGLTKKIELVSHGTDLNSFRLDKDAGHKIRQKFGFKNSDFVLIYTGKIIPSKGIDILIKAFEKVSRKYPVSLLLVGAGPAEYINSIMLSLSKNVQKNIIITGFKDYKELYKYYSAADAAVWPLQESLAMIDAASCSLPFIANHTLGAKERVANDNALLYKQSDDTDLAHKIEYLYQNPKLRKEMGQRGRQLVETSFSWQKVAERYLAKI